MAEETAQPAERLELLQAAEALSRAHMDSYADPSHDWLHVQRVRSAAISLAHALREEGKLVDFLVVELAALFHDLHDSKYATATESVWEDLNCRYFAEQIARGRISESRARLVCKICENVSYSKEVKRLKTGAQTAWHDECRELHCVQDADKLDAMGGIGILRCAAFSAAKKRPLVEHGNPDDSIAHFHDKLLKLKDMMRTERGKQLAKARHNTMLVFLEAVADETNELGIRT